MCVCDCSGGSCLVETATRANGCVNKTSRHFRAASWSQPIWLDEVQCTGQEQSLVECLHANWGTANCGHKEDAGCICDPAVITTTPPTPLLTRHDDDDDDDDDEAVTGLTTANHSGYLLIPLLLTLLLLTLLLLLLPSLIFYYGLPTLG